MFTITRRTDRAQMDRHGESETRKRSFAPFSADLFADQIAEMALANVFVFFLFFQLPNRKTYGQYRITPPGKTLTWRMVNLKTKRSRVL